MQMSRAVGGGVGRREKAQRRYWTRLGIVGTRWGAGREMEREK